jgi:hypothetical protein
VEAREGGAMRAVVDRALKWIFPGVIALDLALVGGRLLDARTALIVGGAVEALAFLLGLRQVTRAVRAYRRDRAAGLDMEAALEEGLGILFPAPVARLIALEPRMWVCLFRWLILRRPLTPEEFRYSKRSPMGALLALICLTTPVEIFAYELLIPWAAVRWALAIVTVYSLIWLFGLYASLQTLPYRLESGGLRVRYGLLAAGAVPYDRIAEVVAERRKAPGGREGVQTAPAQQAGYIATGGRTDVTLRLRAPVALAGLLKPTPPLTTLRLAVDEPDRFVAALRARLPAAEGA